MAERKNVSVVEKSHKKPKNKSANLHDPLTKKYNDNIKLLDEVGLARPEITAPLDVFLYEGDQASLNYYHQLLLIHKNRKQAS